MKRTPLKRKTALKQVSGKKKTIKVKKPKIPSSKSLDTKIWNLCREIIRLKYSHTCYTCGASNLSGSNLQTGHGKPKGALSMKYKYDLRNLRPQCMRCNIHLGGVSDIFIGKLEKEKEGLEFLKDSCRKYDGVWHIDRNQTMGTLEAKFFLLELIEEYKKIVVKLS